VHTKVEIDKQEFQRLLSDKVLGGVALVDDRRVISGIIHVMKPGGRWIDAPACYGPRETLYNRFVRWAVKGVWQELLVTLAGRTIRRGSIDSTHMKAHRSASRSPIVVQPMSCLMTCAAHHRARGQGL